MATRQLMEWSVVVQEVLHAIADKHCKQPKRPQLVGLHGRVPPPCLVTLMKDCWHPVRLLPFVKRPAYVY